MLKVKDVSRLKVFGFEEIENGYKKEHDNKFYKMRIIVNSDGSLNCMNVGYEVTPNWKWIDTWFAEELYELFAVGLLVRVNDDERN